MTTHLNFELAPSPWTQQASCTEVDPDLFFPESGEQHPPEARKLCRACPVKTECLQAAMDDPSLAGMWGGTTPRERKRLRLAAA